MWVNSIASERPYRPVQDLFTEGWYLDSEGIGVLSQKPWYIYCLGDRGPCYRYHEGDEKAREVHWEKED